MTHFVRLPKVGGRMHFSEEKKLKRPLLLLALVATIAGCATPCRCQADSKVLSYEDIVKVMEAGWARKDPRVREETCAYKDGVKLKGRCTFNFEELIAAAESGEFSVPAEFSLTPEQRSEIDMRFYLHLQEIAVARAKKSDGFKNVIGCPDTLLQSKKDSSNPRENMAYLSNPLEDGVIEIGCLSVDLDIPDDIAGFIGKPYPVAPI